MRTIVGLLLLECLSVGCKKEAPPAAKTEPPAWTTQLMPEGLKGVELLKTSLADLKARFPDGKAEALSYNDVPGMSFQSEHAAVLAWVTPAEDKGLVRQASLRGDGLCKWVEANIAKLPNAEYCPDSNRRTGSHGSVSLYCLSIPGAHHITVECSTGGAKDNLLYDVIMK